MQAEPRVADVAALVRADARSALVARQLAQALPRALTADPTEPELRLSRDGHRQLPGRRRAARTVQRNHREEQQQMNTMEDEWERYLASFDVPNRDGDPRRHAFYMGALMMAIKCNVGTRHEIQELANDIDRYMDGCPCPT